MSSTEEVTAWGVAYIRDGGGWCCGLPLEDVKVKGEKHSVSKVAKLCQVDPEVIRKRDDLLTALVTDNRLAQGLDLHTGDFGHDLDMRSIGDYLRWVFSDIAKEETDTIEASGFTVKELGKPISDIAKRYYLAAMNQALAA